MVSKPSIKDTKTQTMKILEKLVQNVPEIPVNEVIVGVFTTLVRAGNLYGVSSTLRGETPHQAPGRYKPLSEMNLRELAELIHSEELLQASVGLAAINAANATDKHFTSVKAQEIIRQKGKGKVVAAVGHFPFLEKLTEPSRLMIFEKQPLNGDFHEKDIRRLLPEADVVAITGTTFINHTFEEVMKHIRPDAFKIVLGPSTPLSPVLFNFGIDAVCGTRVTDFEVMRQCVLEATPVRQTQGKDFVCRMRKDYENQQKSVIEISESN